MDEAGIAKVTIMQTRTVGRESARACPGGGVEMLEGAASAQATSCWLRDCRIWQEQGRGQEERRGGRSRHDRVCETGAKLVEESPISGLGNTKT